jgi:thiaminase/transcriptional activator TenA
MSIATAPLTERLRAASEPVWSALSEHPFLIELGAGTLPLERFRFHLEQDALYLPEYATALAAGAARATDDGELEALAGALRYTLDVELDANARLLERVRAAGAADRGGARELGPAGRGYVSFLHDVAFRGGPLELEAALLPCPWSYAEIGRRLAADPPEHPIYADWIAFVAGPEALALADALVAGLDARAAQLPAARFDALAAAFRMAARYELAFWDAGYALTQWPDLHPDPSAEEAP